MLIDPDPDGKSCWRKETGELKCFKSAKVAIWYDLPPKGVNPEERIVVYSCTDALHTEGADAEARRLLQEAVARRNAATQSDIERRRARRTRAEGPTQKIEGTLLSWVEEDHEQERLRQKVREPGATQRTLGGIDDLLEELTG